LRYWLAPRTARHVGGEQDRRLAGADLPCPQPRDGALTGAAADRLARLQRPRIARRAVPVVALHVAAILRQQHAAHAVAGHRVAGQETVGIAVHPHAAVRGNRRALGIGQPLVHGQAGGLGGARQLDGLLGGEFPRVVEVEVGHLPGHVGGVGQPGELVARRVAGNGAGLGHHLAHGLGPQVGAAGRTLGMVEIDRDSQPAVALVLDGFHLAQPYGDVEALLQADVRFRLGGSRRPGLPEGQRHGFGQFGDA
jgi:hypothetical protein